MKPHKLDKYANYLKMSSKERKKIIDKAVQDTIKRPNPQADFKFPETNFIQLRVRAEGDKEIQLVTYRYPTKNEPVAVLLMFHGLNSHIGHGAHIANMLARSDIVTVGFDHRGFGQSPGLPGKVESLECHLSDSMMFVNLVRKEYPNLPFFPMGLSMGGLTTYYLTLKHPELFEGAIMMAPAIKNHVSDFVVGLAGIFKKILPQNAKLTKPIYGMGSRNPKITDDVKTDPYVYSERVRMATTYFLVEAMDKTPQTFAYYNCPFLIVQGGLDKLVNPELAFELFECSKTNIQDKQILFYEQMWHDIWHEQQIFQIVEKMIEWIKHRLLLKKEKPYNVLDKANNQYRLKP